MQITDFDFVMQIFGSQELKLKIVHRYSSPEVFPNNLVDIVISPRFVPGFSGFFPTD